MKVAAVQYRPDRRHPGRSWERLLALTEQAARDADLVVLPEMCLPGYVFDGPGEVVDWANEPDGPRPRALARVAQQHGCWLVAGLPEIDGGVLFNSAWVFDAQGRRRAVYRKSLLFELDESWARPGTRDYAVFETPVGRMGVGICMDLNDPRFTAWVEREELDVLAFPTNWLDQGQNVWAYWRWRLGDSGALLVAANRWGRERGVDFRGESAILHGSQVLGRAGRRGDEVVVADLTT